MSDKSFLFSNIQEAYGKLEKNKMKKSVAYLQKVFHLISHSANLLRMQVSSIEGCFDRQKSIEEKSQFDRRL